MAARFLEQLESDRVDVVAAALEGGAIERYLDQMEAGNTQVIIWFFGCNITQMLSDRWKSLARMVRSWWTFLDTDGKEENSNC